MADINQTITLGIGTPAGIPEFLMFGLQTAPETSLTMPGLEFTIPESRLEFTIPESRMQYTLPINRLHYTLPEEN